jgi:hypothetical protein
MVEGGISGTDLAAVSRWLRSDHPEIAKELRKSIREAAKPVLDAERAAVKSLTFSTTSTSKTRVLRRTVETTVAGPGRGGGSGAKQRASVKGTQSLAVAATTGQRLLTARQAARAKRGAGLRDTVARGMRITYSDRGKEAKSTVKTTSTAMPAGQKNLPRLINYGRWRHPVFARKGTSRDKQTWVNQHPSRAGWWWQTAEGEMPAIELRLIKSAQMIAAIIAAQGQAVSEQQPVAVHDIFS